ncbi:peptidase A1 [Myriangium duriaei CBS 260.36]|uniref:Peptidase A1 n=1 Tax=Myriangium duriaei CBS 260.36 TaxID=1168546 RepID=A0A9P4IXY9_9PEZI|nr:peptidase A1 [Myriangium duriaei CBS 260.36]
MHTKSAAAIAALAGLAAANPVPVHTINRRGGFSVEQVAVPKKVQHPAAHIAKAYAKYGKQAQTPAHVVKAAQAGGSGQGSVEADPEQGDSEYLCKVQVGKQTLTLDFDTGSADLWVFSDKLQNTGNHGVYQTSSGQAESGSTWQISYGDGSGASGVVYSDTVVIGGVTATGQAVEAATSISSQFSQNAGDGLVGLAFSSINTVKPQPAKTFFDTVSGSLQANLFTARLKKGTPGTYDFGYIDKSKYTGDITYTPVDNSQGFWGFTADSYTVGGASGGSSSGGQQGGNNTGSQGSTGGNTGSNTGGQNQGGSGNQGSGSQGSGNQGGNQGGDPFGDDGSDFGGDDGFGEGFDNGFWKRAGGSSIQGIADTGTTLLLLPDNVVSDYYGKVPGAANDQSQGGYTFDCSATLPDLSFSISGGSITVPGSYINFQSVSGGKCFGGLQSSGQIGTNIFGDIFLKAAFVVFDNSQGSPRLGFAQGA